MVLSEVPRYKVFQPRLDAAHDMSIHTFRIVCWRPRNAPDLEKENTGILLSQIRGFESVLFDDGSLYQLR